MKKIIIILLLLFSTTLKVEAQFYPPFNIPIDKYQVLDSAYLKCTYKLTYIKDTVKKRKSTDIQTLLIGSKISKYFSQYAFEHNLKCQKLIQKGVQSIPSSSEFGALGYEIFKNYPKEKYTVTDFGSHLLRNFIYEESVPDLQWKISKEVDTILSYPCQKATTQFRGRNYEAWFSTAIPINNGPWKFGGLPGLILKLLDSQQNYFFECIGIESLKKKETINLYKINYTHIDRKDLNKLYYRYHNSPNEFEKSLGIRSSAVMVNGVRTENANIKFPYNPIELQ